MAPAQQGSRFHGGCARGVAGFPHIHGSLAGSGQKYSGNRQFNRAQLWMDFQQEAVHSHRQLHFFNQTGNIIGLDSGGKHNQIHGRFNFFSKGQDVLHFDAKGEAFSQSTARNHFRRIVCFKPEKDHLIPGCLLVERFLIPSIGADIPIKIIDAGGRIRLADDIGRIQGCRAAGAGAVLIETPVLILGVDSGNLSAAYAMDHGHAADLAAVHFQVIPSILVFGHALDQLRKSDDFPVGSKAVFPGLWRIGFETGGQNNHAGFDDK